MSNPQKLFFITSYFDNLRRRIENLAKLDACRFDDQSFRDEALILCLLYIDGLASCYYGAGRARGKNKEHFCRALKELSGNALFEKLHVQTTREYVSEKLSEATALIDQLVADMPGQPLDEAEVGRRIRQSPLARNPKTADLLSNLWRCSIGAICYDIMRNPAVHGLGTVPLAFGETLWAGGKGFSLDFAVLHNALKRICEHVAKESVEKQAWFGHSDFMKMT